MTSQIINLFKNFYQKQLVRKIWCPTRLPIASGLAIKQRIQISLISIQQGVKNPAC